MTDEDQLSAYLERPLAPVAAATALALAGSPMEPADAQSPADVDRLLDRSPLAVETGWCTLENGVGYVAVATPMPGVSAEMVDWWFDWHAREPVRYRIWHPAAHLDNSVELPRQPGAKAHWGAVHHPVEDVGTGVVHARIAFLRPTELGFAADGLDLPGGTIVCGLVGDRRHRAQSTMLAHVFLAQGEDASGGLLLRSRFWIGAAIRPYGPLGAPGERLLNNRLARRVLLPKALPRVLAQHCAEEYANLATLLPELYARFGPGV